MALTPLQKSVTSFAENYGNIVAFILWDFTGKDLMVCRLLLCSQGDNLLTHFGFSPPLFYFIFFLSVCLHCVVYISHCVCCAWLTMSECRRINVCIHRSLMSSNWYFSFFHPHHWSSRDEKAIPSASCYYHYYHYQLYPYHHINHPTTTNKNKSFYYLSVGC